MADEKKGMSKGCLVALIVVSVIVILIIASSIICYVKRDSILQWSMIKMSETVKTEVLANLPPGMTEDEVKKTTADFEQAVKDKKVDPAELQSLALLLQTALKDKKIDPEEGRKIIEAMQKATGEAAPPVSPPSDTLQVPIDSGSAGGM